MTTVGLYLRISDDKAAGAGVHRQQQDTEALAKRRGWDVSLYIDNSVSAYKKNVRRPEFERLVADLTARAIDGMVVYDMDRLARQPRDLERLVDLYEPQTKKRGATVAPLVFGTCQGEIDLANDTGIWMARTLVNMAHKSSADTARRVARAHLQRAQEGRTTGGPRPFGWQADRLTLHPVEAPLLQKAVDDVLAGLSLTGIIREWNAAGVTSTSGNPWRTTPLLRAVMLSPRMAGYRVHQGDIAVSRDGQLVMGGQDPMIDVTKWETLCGILSDPERAKGKHDGGRRYLLSGLLRCGNCAQPMVGNAVTKLNTHFYACKTGCRKNSIAGERIDERVQELYERHVAERAAERTLPVNAEWTGAAEEADVAEQLAELLAAVKSRQIKWATVFPTIQGLEARQEELTKEKRAHLASQRSKPVNLTSWSEMTVERRRVTLSDLLYAVVVEPRKSTSSKFDPTRVQPAWR